MAEVNILHLSDLHFDPEHQRDQLIILDALWNDIAFLRSHIISPDLVVFTGDLVNKGGDQNAYTQVRGFFIDRLLQKLELSPERFFLLPGNHEVEISQINPYWELGLQTLSSKDAVNSFLDKIEENKWAFSRLSNFNEFRQSLRCLTPVANNPLWACYRMTIRDTTVGIACLNSAWRATGKPDNHDYGRLLIGERQIDAAIHALEGVDVKILAVHHPMEWLQEFERRDIHRRSMTSFELILYGHNHYPDPHLLQTTAGRPIISNAGCLYQSRSYFNGYSLIRYQSPSRTAIIHLREYLDERRAFDRGLRFAPDGKWESETASQTRALEVVGDALPAYETTIHHHVNGQLLSAIAGSIAPKDIRIIFVQPPLAKLPEHEKYARLATDERAAEFLSVDQILTSEDNILFVGRRESGKTTLLNYLCLAVASDLNPSRVRLPFYIDFRALKASPNSIAHAMQAFSDSQWSRAELEKCLAAGECVLLIDNLTFDDRKRIHALRQFSSQYNKNRYIFAMDQDLYAALNIEDARDLGVPYEKVFIHTFGRKETRALAKRWLADTGTDIDAAVDAIGRLLRRINVPRTPFLVSLILWIMETQKSFAPINHAALVEGFIHGILEKLHPSEGRWAGLDYRNKEHYLAHIAQRMVQKGEDWFDRLDLERATLEYFEAKGLRTSITGFIDYFLNRGVFTELSGRVRFKLRCFFEYFIAKRMIDDLPFRDSIISRKDYLEFQGPFDYLTGLQRDNKELIGLVEERLDAAFDSADLDIDLDLFEEIEVGASPLSAERREELLIRLKGEPLEDEERDELLDSIEPGGEIGDTDKGRDRQQMTPGRIFAETLALCSILVRNCELIDDVAYKRAMFEKCVRYWAKLLLAFVLVTEEIGKSVEIESEEDRERMIYMLKVCVPIGVQMTMFELLGSEKLGAIIAMAAEGTTATNPLMAMMFSFLYADLRERDYLGHLRGMVKQVEGHRYSLEIVFYRLLMYYVLRKLNDDQRRKLESLIGEVLVMMDRSGQREMANKRRDEFVNKLKRWQLQFVDTDSELMGD